MLLNGANTPAPVSVDNDKIITDENMSAAKNALMGAVLMYTAGNKEIPELLKVGLLVAGVGSILINVNKIAKTSQP